MSDSKQKYFPLKPDIEEGFKDPVSWLGGRELVTSLKGMLIYSLYGESLDPRRWMKSVVYPKIAWPSGNKTKEEAANEVWAEKEKKYRDWKIERFEFWRDYFKKHDPKEKKEFWFDYIADSGDGQRGVYGVGCLCLSDLWAAKDKVGACVDFDPYPEPRPKKEKAGRAGSETDACTGSESEDEKILLPRGSFLFVGGDTAYHVADYTSIHERFQMPFRWAFASVRKRMIDKYKPTGDLEKNFIRDYLPDWAWHEETADESKGESGSEPVKEKRLVFNPEWDGTLCLTDDDDKPVLWDTEPLRPLFGLPANHDYYDDLDGFNRQFRRPPFEDVEENRADRKYMKDILLKIPTFGREQEASYTALRLPFNWWFLGIDSENEKLDFRQRIFFEQLMDEEDPKKVIIGTPEPTTIFGRECDPKTDKTAQYLQDITAPMGLEQPFQKKGELTLAENSRKHGDYCRLDLSGDVHHYARYWGPADNKTRKDVEISDNYASLVAGGGGAFFDSTDTMVGKLIPDPVFPEAGLSCNAVADRIFDLSNIKKGGYIQIVGAALAVFIFFCLYIVGPTKDFFSKLVKKEWMDLGIRQEWPAIALLVASIVFLFISGHCLHKLNKHLKDARHDNPHEDDGRIKQLWPTLLWFGLGVGSYILFIRTNGAPRGEFLLALHSFLKSFLLLAHFAGVGALLYIGTEYLNWLPLRFKIIRKSGVEPRSWLARVLFTSDKEIDKDRGKRDSFFKRLREKYRKKSIENLPVFTINLCAIAILLLGIYLLGDRPLHFIGADLLLMLIILGALVGLYFLAVSVGGSYHRGITKYFSFGAVGAWHAFLQLPTAFVLVYYGDPGSVVAVIALSIFMNGFSGVRTFLKFLIRDFDVSDVGWKKSLRKVVTMRFGSWVMKKHRRWLFAVWIAYGALVLAMPYLFKRTGLYTQSVGTQVFSITKSLFTSPPAWLPYVILLVIAGYLGYRMSRVWASWYFAVAMTFNGHNNEAGGAARIQGFKHILRIKVEEKQLTVYVIGFDKPEIKLSDLKPRIVDRFVLNCKTFQPPTVMATGGVEKPK